MNVRSHIVLLAIAWLAMHGVSTVAQSQPKLYRWVDEQGVVHYGDRVPPQYADRDRTILNEQGIAIDRQEGTITEAERAALERQQAAEAAERQAQAAIARRDRMLLQTYLSVADIEDLRDRRLELLESQITVTELYLQDLRKRLVGLHAEAAHFKPYAENDDAAQIPADLARDISRTVASITLYEETLSRTRSEQEDLRAAFEADIARFKELKGG